VDALQVRPLGHAEAAMGRELQAMSEDSFLDLVGDAVRVRPLGSRESVEQAFSSAGLVVAMDLIELLAGVAHDLAGFAAVAQLGGKLQQAELATCYFGRGSHLSFGKLLVLATTNLPGAMTASSLTPECQVNTITAHLENS